LVRNPPDYAAISAEWDEFVAKIKADRKQKDYDVLFALSGGKDSVTALYLTVKKYGLKPLCFTIDHGFKDNVILDNCLNITKLLKVDWLLMPVDELITQKIKIYALAGDLPCKYCNTLWKETFFNRVIDMFRIDIIFTGGDSLVDNKSYFHRENWHAKLVGLPLAANHMCEQEIYDIAIQLGWKKPKIDGWDTDCTAVGVGLWHYRNNNQGSCHVEEKRHLSHLVRHQILSKNEAINLLAQPIKVSEETWKLFEE
jgi:PP-loop superfamily ATP-utilizing enzyme